jgi:trimeric autotransporter adhesin
MIKFMLFALSIWTQAFPSLIASYAFSGNTLDNSGNGKNGTLIGANYAADRFGNENSALSFDGINDYVNLPNLSLSGPVSVSGWFSFSGDIWPHHMALLGQGSDYYERWTLGFWYDRRGSDNNPYKIETEISGDNWHHLAAVVSDDANIPYKVKIFLDGEYLGNISSRGFKDIGNDYQIGSFYTEWGWEYSKGMIDDVNVYNHALSDAEVNELFHVNSVPEPTSIALLFLGIIVIGSIAYRKRRKS